MANEKKFKDKEALFYDLTIGETIERVGAKVAGACLFYALKVLKSYLTIK